MKSIFTLLLFVFMIGCSSPDTLESRVKNYMSDTVAKQLHDPASFQFVSMQVDTLTGKDDYEQLKRLSENTVLFDSVKRAEMKDQLKQIEQNPAYMDSVFSYFINVTYKGNNKLGTPVPGKARLKYFPQEGRMQLLGN